LKKVTLTPEAVVPEDARALLDLGLSEEAIGDALNVCFLFNIYDRLADTLGWEVPDPAVFRRGASLLLDYGYRSG
jgi:hypothetical protein